MQQINILQNIYLFKGLTGDQLEKVNEVCELETFAPGDDLFNQGDVATAMYVIGYGSVKIHILSTDGDNIEVTNLGTGSHFGEMAFLDDEERSASATAIEKTSVIKIDYKKLKSLLETHTDISVHVYRELAKFLCGRLRITTNDLSFAREKNLSHF